MKNSVKQAIKFIDDFEQTAIDMAIYHEYDYVVCGHIHQPAKRLYVSENAQTLYLNSGDWIENLTALEYHNGEWVIYHHPEKHEEYVMEEDELMVKLPSMQRMYGVNHYSPSCIQYLIYFMTS